MTHQKRVEPLKCRSARGQGVAGACEPDWLITKCRQHLLLSQQLVAIIIDHQYGFAMPEVRHSRSVFSRQLIAGGRARQPDFEVTACSRRAADINRSAMLTHDFASRCKSKPIAR